MLDGLTLDQLRTFLAAADEGSFTAAGKRLGRAQSVVSQTLANLERQIGVKLFERNGKYPVLTREGTALLADVRAVERDVSDFKARARALSGGLEPELSICVDVMFPIDVLTRAVRGFNVEFPRTQLRIEVEILGGVLQPVVEDRCAFSLIGFLPGLPQHFSQEPLMDVPFVLVAAADHPLARVDGDISTDEMGEHVQILLTDRSNMSAGQNFGVISPRLWRVADNGAKLAFIRAGLGFGGAPLHMVEDDLRNGSLVRLRTPGFPPDMRMPMRAVHRTEHPPGPAGRWLIERLKENANVWPDAKDASHIVRDASELTGMLRD
jgi:DNA-binding transcriptional LysR family regulator